MLQALQSSRYVDTNVHHLFNGQCLKGNLLQTFITTFQELIDAPTTGTREMSVAVRGYGYFAAVSFKYVCWCVTVYYPVSCSLAEC